MSTSQSHVLLRGTQKQEVTRQVTIWAEDPGRPRFSPLSYSETKVKYIIQVPSQD